MGTAHATYFRRDKDSGDSDTGDRSERNSHGKIAVPIGSPSSVGDSISVRSCVMLACESTEILIHDY